jgi:hypothetical protein
MPIPQTKIPKIPVAFPSLTKEQEAEITRRMERLAPAVAAKFPSPIKIGLMGAALGLGVGAIRKGSLWKYALAFGGIGWFGTSALEGVFATGLVIGYGAGAMAPPLPGRGYLPQSSYASQPRAAAVKGYWQ